MVSRAIIQQVTHRSLLRLSLGLLWFATGGRLQAGLDLSPQADTYELDGMEMAQLAFQNSGNEKATYQLPRDWRYSGDRDHLDLQPPNVSQANVRISKLTPGAVALGAADTQTRLLEQAIASVPEGSREVKIESQGLNPLLINGKQTFLIELSYVAFGEKFASYQLYLDRTPEPICFKLSCRERDYPELRQLFQRSLYTWQHL